MTAYSLRVRKGPDTNFDMIGGLQKDDCIQIIGRNKNADWGLIDFEGLRGWASLEYISTSGNLRNLPIVKGEFNQTITPILTTATITFTPLPSLTNTPRPSPTKDILNCKDADQHIGSYVTCKMPQAYCSYNPDVSGDPTFCNDAPYPGHSFTLVIWEKDASYLDGRCLLVSGFVSSYQGKPQIEMEDTSGVSFCK